MIDIHIHILPGIDDGPDDMDEALAMCRQATADGVTRLVAAPHMLNGMYDVTPDMAREGVVELRRRLEEEGIDLDVAVGADVHVTTDLPDLLAQGEVLTIGDHGRHIMLELSQDVMPPGLLDVLFELQLASVTPIITHPERNLEVQSDPDALLPLVEAGNLVQVTADSLTGRFGERPQRCVRELMERRLAHFVASDAHSATRRKPGLSGAREVVNELLSEEEAQEMFVSRPALVLDGGHVEPPEPAAKRKGRSKWFWW